MYATNLIDLLDAIDIPYTSTTDPITHVITITATAGHPSVATINQWLLTIDTKIRHVNSSPDLAQAQAIEQSMLLRYYLFYLPRWNQARDTQVQLPNLSMVTALEVLPEEIHLLVGHVTCVVPLGGHTKWDTESDY